MTNTALEDIAFIEREKNEVKLANALHFIWPHLAQAVITKQPTCVESCQTF